MRKSVIKLAMLISATLHPGCTTADALLSRQLRPTENALLDMAGPSRIESGLLVAGIKNNKHYIN